MSTSKSKAPKPVMRRRMRSESPRQRAQAAPKIIKAVSLGSSPQKGRSGYDGVLEDTYSYFQAAVDALVGWLQTLFGISDIGTEDEDEDKRPRRKSRRGKKKAQDTAKTSTEGFEDEQAYFDWQSDACSTSSTL